MSNIGCYGSTLMQWSVSYRGKLYTQRHITRSTFFLSITRYASIYCYKKPSQWSWNSLLVIVWFFFFFTACSRSNGQFCGDLAEGAQQIGDTCINGFRNNNGQCTDNCRNALQRVSTCTCSCCKVLYTWKFRQEKNFTNLPPALFGENFNFLSCV